MRQREFLAVLLALTTSTTTWAQTAAFANQGKSADQRTQADNSKTGDRNHTLFGAVSENRLRFAALGELIELRLEVIAPTGEVVFDSGFKAGNALDWLAADKPGQALADATYLCLITIKDATGKLTRYRALMVVREQTLSLKQSDPSQLAPAQAEAAGESSEAEANITLIEASAPAATAILAHDGNTAHLVSASGGLTISSGNFFSNKVMEQVRLTAEGNLGLGLANPQVRLDVNGRIRASEGLVFPDGSIQLSAASQTLGAASQRSGQAATGQGEEGVLVPDISGTGTTGKISKWLDGPAGVLGDANLTEVGGAIGVNGTPDTRFRLDVNGSTRIRGSNPGFNLEGLRAAGNIWLFQTVDDDGRFRLFGQDNVNPGVERLTIKLDTGNVGIGATTPTAKLDVAGAINTSTQYNIAGLRVFTVSGAFNDGTTILTATNSFVGDSAGLNTTPNADPTSPFGKFNAFFGAAAGKANTTGNQNAFFGAEAGQANTIGAGNAFFGRLTGFANTTGNNNAFFGGFAGRKNTMGSSNTFLGVSAGFENLAGANNTYVGFSADANASNPTGQNNTLLGALTRINPTVSNSTAIGAFASVTQSNALILGPISGVNGCLPANNCASVNVGIGTTAPSERLHVIGNGLFTGNLTVNGTLNAALPSGSANYIQNQNASAQSADFNISGNGTVVGTLSAGVVNAATQYNIVSPALGSTIRLLGISGAGDSNTFLGRNAAQANPTGSFNSFFGNGAGQSTVSGGNNSFFGSGAGNVNVSGTDNAFFGRNAGFANTASDNAFFGSFAGASNTSGTSNAFFGKEAGRNNTAGTFNSFFGSQTGANNTTGTYNAFFGFQAGQANTTGDNNAFFGNGAGLLNTIGSQNTFFGSGAGVANTTGTNNTFFGYVAGQNTTTGNNNAFIGELAGLRNSVGNNNIFIGTSADFNTFDPTGDNNILLGVSTTVNSGVTNGTAIGFRAAVTQSNALVLGSINGVNGATADTTVGIGTTAPQQTLHVNGLEVLSTGAGAGFKFRDRGSASSTDDWVWYSSGNVARFFRAGTGDLLTISTAGVVALYALGAAGSTQLCRNASNQISTCSSSRRYKSNIATLDSGLSLINRLRPVTFDWKQSGEHDLGLVAEEVAKVEPLLVTRNAKGEVEGVKYDRVGVVLLNAVKEQQAQIAAQQTQIENQQQEIELLKRLVCLRQPRAEICKAIRRPINASKRLAPAKRAK